MRYKRTISVAFITPLLIMVLSGSVSGQKTGPLESDHVKALEFREMGPAVTGGRIHDVEALTGQPSTIYVGTASGGVWKSVNGGTTWKPLWDDLPNSSVGDIALSSSDPDIIYVGTGGPNNRQSTLYGNGVWKSTDGGESWIHLGLVETRHIGRIRIDPGDPDVVYVAALGNLWKAGEERGVFKSTDGGRRWRKVLYVDEDTGAVDLVMDPSDPEVLYAATYQRRRRTWGFTGGGPGSGIYKTTNGGRTWSPLTEGLPDGDKGRIGLAISRTSPKVLNATVEHNTQGGIYRTEDGGESWLKVNNLNPRPMYYSHIYIDPLDENRVYVLGTTSSVSEDGGKNFSRLPSSQSYDVGVHADHHSLWIDPSDTEHLLLGGDAGLYVSFDRGITWLRINNLAIGQFYGIGVDMRDPYWVYGGMQDNHSWMGPSRTRRFIGIINDDWRQIGFGDGMYTQPDPLDHRRVYVDSNGGGIVRFDSETGGSQGIKPVPPEGERYRFDWTSPILISPHDHLRIYLGGNRLFISEDGGDSWNRTDDLSRALDRDQLKIMGAIPGRETLSRHDGTSSYGEITTVDESPLLEGLLWVGTDDGNVQISRDGGVTWTNVISNIRGVPDLTYVSRVEASHFEPGRAYVTFDAHRDGDFRPYVFVTQDYGQSWETIIAGLPAEGSVNVIREHFANPDFLLLGTEHNLFVSLDRGEKWLLLKNNLPTVPVDDLVIHPRENDLIIGTHGRSLWVLDDLTPLSEMSSDVAASSLHLFTISPATQWQKWKATSYRGQGAYAASQPPDGAVINYWLSSESESPVDLEIIDPSGRVIRRLEGSGEKGIQRVIWDLRLAPLPSEGRRGTGSRSRSDPNMTQELEALLAPRGPFVLPDRYTVRVSANGSILSGSVEVRPDPLDNMIPTRRRERWSFLLELDNLAVEAFENGLRIRELRDRLSVSIEAVSKVDVPPVGLKGDLDRLQSELNDLYREEWSTVRSRASSIISTFAGSAIRQGTLSGPTEEQRERLADLSGRHGKAATLLKELLGTRIPELDMRLEQAGLPTILKEGRR